MLGLLRISILFWGMLVMSYAIWSTLPRRIFTWIVIMKMTVSCSIQIDTLNVMPEVWDFLYSSFIIWHSRLMEIIRSFWWFCYHVRKTHVWPPRPPPDAPAQFCDIISLCLKLDETQRLGVDELLKHDFITTHSAELLVLL
jgi:serine/threonine protein kinase